MGTKLRPPHEGYDDDYNPEDVERALAEAEEYANSTSADNNTGAGDAGGVPPESRPRSGPSSRTARAAGGAVLRSRGPVGAGEAAGYRFAPGLPPVLGWEAGRAALDPFINAPGLYRRPPPNPNMN